MKFKIKKILIGIISLALFCSIFLFFFPLNGVEASGSTYTEYSNFLNVATRNKGDNTDIPEYQTELFLAPMKTGGTHQVPINSNSNPSEEFKKTSYDILFSVDAEWYSEGIVLEKAKTYNIKVARFYESKNVLIPDLNDIKEEFTIKIIEEEEMQKEFDNFFFDSGSFVGSQKKSFNDFVKLKTSVEPSEFWEDKIDSFFVSIERDNTKFTQKLELTLDEKTFNFTWVSRVVLNKLELNIDALNNYKLEADVQYLGFQSNQIKISDRLKDTPNFEKILFSDISVSVDFTDSYQNFIKDEEEKKSILEMVERGVFENNLLSLSVTSNNDTLKVDNSKEFSTNELRYYLIVIDETGRLDEVKKNILKRDIVLYDGQSVTNNFTLFGEVKKDKISFDYLSDISESDFFEEMSVYSQIDIFGGAKFSYTQLEGKNGIESDFEELKKDIKGPGDYTVTFTFYHGESSEKLTMEVDFEINDIDPPKVLFEFSLIVLEKKEFEEFSNNPVNFYRVIDNSDEQTEVVAEVLKTGSLYELVVTVTDKAGNSASYACDIFVKSDNVFFKVVSGYKNFIRSIIG